MIDENNYLKHKTVCKSCYNKNRRKNTITESVIDTTPNNQKSIMLTKRSPLFQHMKIMPVLFLAHETLVKFITCSKF